ncbi:hypothetical protein [Mycobacteroides abscessus]|uniref:hypothetical protein n=1 Tax=Mycobacteroides abscessus TaxID=36809 RepID=UPI00104FDC28|nr:hypothetical protein [Mycobacteroides abscessus]
MTVPNSRKSCMLVAKSAHTGIWHTEVTDSMRTPARIPPRGERKGLYRGAPVKDLPHILVCGIDRPDSRDPFFARPHYREGAIKAWEYPLSRKTPLLLVFDEEMAARSYVLRDAHADADFPGSADYPYSYVNDRGQRVHTRYPPDDAFSPSFTAEEDSGYWIPGGARDALLDIVIGGPTAEVEESAAWFAVAGPLSCDLGVGRF